MATITLSRSMDTVETPSSNIEGVQLVLENAVTVFSDSEGSSIVSVILNYIPRHVLLRRKSLRTYLESFSSETLSCEEMALKILAELDLLLETKSIRVEVIFQSTGLPTISTVVRASD